MRPFHLSTMKKCILCGEDFVAYKATICEACHRLMQKKKSEANYPGWVDNGGKPKEL